MFTFHPTTSAAVRQGLIDAATSGARVRIWYGDPKTGRAWPEEHDVLGTIGRSTGPARKVPLLICRSGSDGGGSVMDHCIVRIDETTGRTLYRHPSFSSGVEGATVTPHGAGYQVRTAAGDTLAGRKTEQSAHNWIAFMDGRRYCK